MMEKLPHIQILLQPAIALKLEKCSLKVVSSLELGLKFTLEIVELHRKSFKILVEAEVTDTIIDVSKKTTKPSKKSQRAIKLNIKQGLIMNQILSTYGLNDPNNSLCKDHVNEFKSGLRALQPWALKSKGRRSIFKLIKTSSLRDPSESQKSYLLEGALK